MTKHRIGMIVPSLNTIAEDDFRRFCPQEVFYHVHRVRLRKEGGRVTMESLMRAYLEACDEAQLLNDLSPDAIAFNCTGASVACGDEGDGKLAQRMTAVLGVPCTNTMVAIKQALVALGARRVLHVCPFTGEFSRIEADSLRAAGIDIQRTVSLDFTDAKVASRLEPRELADFARGHADTQTGAVLLSCANVRAFEAADALEQDIGLPVVTSNQAMLWGLLHAAGWRGTIEGAGKLFRLAQPALAA